MIQRRGLAAFVLALACLPLGLSTRCLARDDWTNYGRLSYNPGMHSTSGFDLNPGRGYNFDCNLCNKTIWIPTLDYSIAVRWVRENHLPSVHGINPGATTASSSTGGWEDIQREAIRTWAEGRRTGNVQMQTQARNAFVAASVMQPVSNLVRDAVTDFFNPAPAGPTPQELARQRLERNWRAFRESDAREDFQILQQMALARSRTMREEQIEGDVERSERLAGAFDVAPPRRSSSFFGIEGNPSDGDTARVLAEDQTADPFRPLFDSPPVAGADGQRSLGAFEQQLRAEAGIPVQDAGVVVLDRDVLATGVDPGFLADQARRAQETQNYWRSQSTGGFQGPPAAPATPSLEDIGRTLVARGVRGERDRLVGDMKAALPRWTQAELTLIDHEFAEMKPENLVNPAKAQELITLTERLGVEFYQNLRPETPEPIQKLQELKGWLDRAEKAKEIWSEVRKLDFSEARKLFRGTADDAPLPSLPMPSSHGPSDR